jgi:hypothetical protein
MRIKKLLALRFLNMEKLRLVQGQGGRINYKE